MLFLACHGELALDDSPARVEIALGEARLSLGREVPQRFDILFLDAFSSHTVPTHLLTREAFEMWPTPTDLGASGDRIECC